MFIGKREGMRRHWQSKTLVRG